jgi:hypothetical protein
LDTAKTVVAALEGLGLLLIILLGVALDHALNTAPKEKRLHPIQRRLASRFVVFPITVYLCYISGFSWHLWYIVALSVYAFFIFVDLVVYIFYLIAAIFICTYKSVSEWRKKQEWWHKPQIFVEISEFMKEQEWWHKPQIFMKKQGWRHKPQIFVEISEFMKKRGWWYQPEDLDKTPAEATSGNFLQPFVKWSVVISMLAIVVFWGVFTAGKEQALNQTDFLVPSTNPNSVVLRVYGDNLICAPFHDKSVEPSFFVLKLDDEPRPHLELRNVGPLTSTGIVPEGNSTSQDSDNTTGR